MAINPTKAEKKFHDDLCSIVGCIACRIDGNENYYVSIHHCDGRSKKGCHLFVLPLCAGHHQDQSGPDKSMIARHPYKAQFEERYGTEEQLLEMSQSILDKYYAVG